MPYPGFTSKQGLTEKQRGYVGSGRVEPVIKSAIKLSQAQLKLLSAMAEEGSYAKINLLTDVGTLYPDGVVAKKSTIYALEKHRLVKATMADKPYVKLYDITELGRKVLFGGTK